MKKLLYMLRYLFLLIKKRVKIDGFIFIQKDVRIIIERGGELHLGKNCVLKEGTIIYVKKNAKLYIGNNTRTGHHTEISCGKDIKMGNDVIMGAYTYITDSNHNYDNKNILIRKQGMSLGSVRIGSNIWIGRNCMILKDSEISDNSVVAAGAIVTKKFQEEYVVIGGIPAKKIKVFK